MATSRVTENPQKKPQPSFFFFRPDFTGGRFPPHQKQKQQTRHPRSQASASLSLRSLKLEPSPASTAATAGGVPAFTTTASSAASTGTLEPHVFDTAKLGPRPQGDDFLGATDVALVLFVFFLSLFSFRLLFWGYPSFFPCILQKVVFSSFFAGGSTAPKEFKRQYNQC